MLLSLFSRKRVYLIIGVVSIIWLFSIIRIAQYSLQHIENEDTVLTLSRRLAEFEIKMAENARDATRLRQLIDIETNRRQMNDRNRQRLQLLHGKQSSTVEWTQPIAVLVIVCNRDRAIDNHLQNLIKYRPSAHLFPIIVSQDCDSQPVADTIQRFGSNVSYIKHTSGDISKLTIPPHHRQYSQYYLISRHYRLALEHVFDQLKYTSVIITEDDLDIAPDFFEYFSATRRLLAIDPTLMCVSAWNDNGKASAIDRTAVSQLYRSDFLPGLGWMLIDRLWNELRSQWPAGFWDDWIRDPARRRNRACIRPEVSRTSMTLAGKMGASKGLFFEQHLGQIVLNRDEPVQFTKMNLDYLLKSNYDVQFIADVNNAQLMTYDELKRRWEQQNQTSSMSIRIPYDNMYEFVLLAARLEIMFDSKAGVPRTAYLGIVTCFVNSTRIYLTPPANWTEYDPKWEPPAHVKI